MKLIRGSLRVISFAEDMMDAEQAGFGAADCPRTDGVMRERDDMT